MKNATNGVDRPGTECELQTRLSGAKSSHRSDEAPGLGQRLARFATVSPRLWFSFAVFAIASMIVLPTIWAQPQIQQEDGAESDVLTLAPRSLRRQIDEAKKALAEKRYGDVVDALGKILMEEPQEGLEAELGQDYFTEIRPTGRIQKSIRSQASEILGTIPEDQQNQIELRYGVASEQKLSAAIAANDWEAIEQVSRQYFHTNAGFEAASLTAQRLAASGQPLAAALQTQRLLGTPAACRLLGPNLAAFAAQCWLEVGRRDRALEVLKSASTLWPQKTIQWRGIEVATDPATDFEKQFLNKLVSRSPRDRTLGQDWPIASANPTRNGEGSAARPLGTPRWRVPLSRGRPDEMRIEQILKSLPSNATALIPSAQAIVVGNTAIFKTIDRSLRAVDLLTGKIVWDQHLSSLRWENREEPFFQRGEQGEAISERLAERVWQEPTYWQLSADQERVYMISEHSDGDSEVPGLGQPIQIGMRNTFMQMQNINYLEACSLQGEGKWVWRVGGLSGEGEPKLANATFLGAPLPIEGTLYSIVEVNGETMLAALAASTGKLLWSQQLAQIQSGMVEYSFGDLKAATPAYADGIIVCPTNNGVVVAVDLASRSLRWAYRYENLSNPNRNFLNQGGRGDTSALRDSRWTGNSVTISDGRVLVTSPESKQLLCLDLVTGEKLWEMPRGDNRFIGGVVEDKVLLVGNRVVTAVGLKDSKPAWKTKPIELEADERVVGIGVRRGATYYLPTSRQEILEIDVVDGKIKSRTKINDRLLGNLIAFREQILSISPLGVSLYYTIEDLRQQMLARLKSNPTDPWAIARKAELLLSENRQTEALETLRTAYEKDRQNEEIRLLLIDTVLEGMRRDFAAHRAFAVELEPSIDLWPQRTQFLIEMIRGDYASGEVLGSFNRLVELADWRSKEQSGRFFERAEWLDLGPNHRVSIDRWIQSQATRMYTSAPASQRELIDQQLSKIVASASKLDVAQRERLLRYFGELPQFEPIALQTANDILAERGARFAISAEQLLVPIATRVSSPLQKDAFNSLLRLYEQADRPTSVQSLTQLVKSLSNGVDRRAGDYLLETNQATSWPKGLIETELLTLEVSHQRPITSPVPIIDQDGVALIGCEIRDGNDRMMIADPFGAELLTILSNAGEQRFRNTLPVYCHLQNSLVVLQRKPEIAVIDTLRSGPDTSDALVWRLDTVSSESEREGSSPVSNPFGMDLQRNSTRGVAKLGAVAKSTVIVQRGANLEGYELLTGSKVWEFSGLGNKCEITSLDDELIVVDFERSLRRTFNVIDGTQSSNAPLELGWQVLTTATEHIIDFKEEESTTFDQFNPESAGKGKAILRIWNAKDGKVAFQKELGKNARLTTLAGRYVVALDEEGNLTFWDLNRKIEANHKVSPSPKLKQINLIQQYDRLILLTSSTEIEPETYSVSPNTSTTRSIWVNGDVYAISPTDGGLLWSRPARMVMTNVTRQQSSRSPILFFHRRLQWTRPVERTANLMNDMYQSLAAIDVRDGTLVFADNFMPITSQEPPTCEVDAVSHVVVGKQGSGSVRLIFTDKDAPPQPIADFGEVSSNRTPESNPDGTAKEDVDPFDLFNERK